MSPTGSASGDASTASAVMRVCDSDRAPRTHPTGGSDPPVEHLAQDALLDTGHPTDLLERLVAPQRIGDVADGRHHRIDEAHPAGRCLDVVACRVMADEEFDEGLRLGDARLPVGRGLTQDLVRILAVGQPHDPDVLELDAGVIALELADETGQGGHPKRAGLLPRRVDVVRERDPVGVTRQQPDLVRCERGPEAGHDVLEAGLMRHQRVGVALDDDGLVAGTADRTLGLVDQVQRPALVEQRRRRRVEVLGPLPFQQAAAEPDGIPVLVADREDRPGPGTCR